MSIKIKALNHDGAPLAVVSGELSGEAVSRLSKTIDGYLNAESQRVILDLAGVTFIDSHGLGYLIHVWKTLRDVGRELVLVHPSEFVWDILENANLHKLITVVESLEQL